MTSAIRFSIIAAVSFIIAAAFVVYDSYSALAAVTVLQEFQTEYLIRLSTVRVLGYLPLVLATGGIVTFSLAVGPYDLGGQGMLIRMIRPTLLIVLGIGVVFGIWVGVFAPQMQLRLRQIEYQSEVAATAWNDAKTARDVGRLDVAERYALIYRSVAGRTDEVEQFLNEVQTEISLAERSRRIASWGEGATEAPRLNEAEEMGIAELLRRAEAFYAEGQWYSAHYYATRAVGLSGGRSDARAVQSDALNAIEREAVQIEDEPIRSYFERKQGAYGTFLRGDPIEAPEALITAYYLFQDLHEDDPDDPDVARYLELATERVAEISFYVDEAQFYGDGRRFSGHNNIVFRNRSSDRMTEYVTAERMVQTPQGVFFYDIEIYQETQDGYRHFRANFGKRIKDNLFLRAIERDPEGGTFRDDQAGADHIFGAELIDQSGEGALPGYIPLQFTTEEIIRVSGGRETYETLTLVDLFRLPPILSALGQPESPALMAIARRLLVIFGLFTVSFFAIGLGWRYRSYYLGRPPFLALLAIPVFPTVLWFFKDIPGLILSILVNGLALRLSTTAVLVIVTGALFLLLVVSIALVARQRIEP